VSRLCWSRARTVTTSSSESGKRRCLLRFGNFRRSFPHLLPACSYYVNNDYWEQELIDSPPEQVDINRVRRSILHDKPRVTRYPIDWGPADGVSENAAVDLNVENSNDGQMQPKVDAGMDMEMEESMQEEMAQ
jgi:hypothetical protein